MKLKLPIGIQSFEKIIENGFLYVDKTEDIYNLTQRGNYYFLSRPRRFGKSLLLSTIKELYNGKRHLFKNLWVEKQWDWTEQHPVIHISFSSIGYKTMGLEVALNKMLDEQAEMNGLQLTTRGYDQKFKELIKKSSRNNKVVLLIDEYDKPLIDYLEDLPKAKEHQQILKSFYSVLKDADPHIRLRTLRLIGDMQLCWATHNRS